MASSFGSRGGWGTKSSAVSSTEELDEAGMAVGFILLLLEAAFAQGLQAEVAHKVVGMEFGPHGCDTAAQDGLLASLAHAATGLVVVGLAQRLTLVFKEAAIHKGAVALLRRQGGGKKDAVSKSQQKVLTHAATFGFPVK